MARSGARSAPHSHPGGGLSDRLVSLDAFRGFTVAAMILVNNPGDWSNAYAPLLHAKWNGWTFTDTIFPFFLFIAGVSMALSLSRRPEAGALPHLLRRAAIIIAIGLALNAVPNFDLATLRIPGVLQRIGLCIALAAPIVLHFERRGIAACIVAILAAYAFVMLFVPVPGPDGQVAAGVLEPGRDAGAYLDRLVLGERHLWSQSRTWDPEGLLSTLPALATLLIGYLAGRGLLSPAPPAEKTGWMMTAGMAGLAVGVFLNAQVMPINKSLWSISYCVFMAGWALLALAVFYWLADANGSAAVRDRARAWMRPFTIFGLNALFIFALSGLVARLMGAWGLKAAAYGPIRTLPLAPVDASLAYAILFLVAMFAVAWAMWRRGWFIKV